MCVVCFCPSQTVQTDVGGGVGVCGGGRGVNTPTLCFQFFNQLNRIETVPKNVDRLVGQVRMEVVSAASYWEQLPRQADNHGLLGRVVVPVCWNSPQKSFFSSCTAEWFEISNKKHLNKSEGDKTQICH